MINLILKNAEHLEDYIDQLSSKFSGEILVTIKEIKGVNKSRAEYFARIGEFAEEMGYNRKEMHEFVKDNILEYVTKHEQFVDNPASIGELSTTVLNEVKYRHEIKGKIDNQ